MMVKNCSKARLYINNRQPSIIHLILLSNNSILYFCVIINDYHNLREKILCNRRLMRVMGLTCRSLSSPKPRPWIFGKSCSEAFADSPDSILPRSVREQIPTRNVGITACPSYETRCAPRAPGAVPTACRPQRRRAPEQLRVCRAAFGDPPVRQGGVFCRL